MTSNAEFFRHIWTLRKSAVLYVTPAFPGSDAGCFPAAHVRETLDSEYADWLDVLAYCDEYRAYSLRMAALYDGSEPEFEDDSEATLRVDANEDDWKGI